jgi:hypothetical protein
VCVACCVLIHYLNNEIACLLCQSCKHICSCCWKKKLPNPVTIYFHCPKIKVTKRVHKMYLNHFIAGLSRHSFEYTSLLTRVVLFTALMLHSDLSAVAKKQNNSAYRLLMHLPSIMQRNKKSVLRILCRCMRKSCHFPYCCMEIQCTVVQLTPWTDLRSSHRVMLICQIS